MVDNTLVPNDFADAHKKKGYRLLGNNMASYKPCHYWKSALTDRIFCYKYHFYGAPASHRCIQWSPVIECNEACEFCWRIHRSDIGLPPVRAKDLKEKDWPRPKALLRELMDVYKGTLRGFNPKHREKTESDLWKDAMEEAPHLATSLTGEPLLYPYVGELMKIATERGMTTFIVSNGTVPKRMEKMEALPTQFYITLAGPDYKTWSQVTHPVWNAKKQWSKLNKSLELLSSLNTRTVIRITAIEGVNMAHPEKYVNLLEKAEPNFVSIKGFTHVGGSQKRMNTENQPNMEEVEQFAEGIARKISYKVEEKVKRGRAVLLWDESEKRLIKEKEYERAER